jgi:hypothetical protein
LQPPRPEIIIVEGSELDRVYTEANIKHAVTSAESLIAEGYVNPFLIALAPTISAEPKPQPSWPIDRGAVSTSKITGAQPAQWREPDHIGRGADPARLHGGGARVA